LFSCGSELRLDPIDWRGRRGSRQAAGGNRRHHHQNGTCRRQEEDGQPHTHSGLGLAIPGDVWESQKQRPPAPQLEESTGESSQSPRPRRAPILNTIPVPARSGLDRMKQSVLLQ